MLQTNPQTTLEREVSQLMIDALRMDRTADSIDPEMSLFGEGLGLDSIDILEVALEVSHQYGFQLRSDDERKELIFKNVRSLAAHVAENRAN